MLMRLGVALRRFFSRTKRPAKPLHRTVTCACSTQCTQGVDEQQLRSSNSLPMQCASPRSTQHSWSGSGGAAGRRRTKGRKIRQTSHDHAQTKKQVRGDMSWCMLMGDPSAASARWKERGPGPQPAGRDAWPRPATGPDHPGQARMLLQGDAALLRSPDPPTCATTPPQLLCNGALLSPLGIGRT
jgi:hypothetical protein